MRVTRDKSVTTSSELVDEIDSSATTMNAINAISELAEALPLAVGYRNSEPNDSWSHELAAREAAMAQLQAQLNEPLEEGLTKWRKGYGVDEKTGKTRMLEYLEWHTVTRQLNRIFGANNWSWEVRDIRTFGEDPKTGVPRVVSAIATLSITWPNGQVTSYTNNGLEVVKGSSWESFEMAFKGAAHDAFKRAATALGEQFGLSLYVKEEETKVARSTAATDSEATTATHSATTHSAAASTPTRREAPRQAPSQTSSSADEYNPENDTVAYCEDCDREIRGYRHKTTGKVYTTQDLVDISKRNAGGRVLCYNCRQNARS